MHKWITIIELFVIPILYFWLSVMNTINSKQLDALIHNNAIKTIKVDGTSGGFVITINDTVFEARRGNARIFKKLQAAATFLKNKGIGEFKVNISHWAPEQPSLH